MSNEPTERDVDPDCICPSHLIGMGLSSTDADHVTGIVAERIAQARREGAADALAPALALQAEWEDAAKMQKPGTGVEHAAAAIAAVRLRAALRGDA